MSDLYKHAASIPKRGLAFLIDLVVMNLVLFSPFEGIMGQYVKGSWAEGWALKSIPGELVAVILAMCVLSLLYLALFEYWLQQTVGMMFLGLYVDGSLSLGRLLIRNLFIIPFFPFFILWVVEPLYLVFRGERWLEQLTHTRTVELAEYMQ